MNTFKQSEILEAQAWALCLSLSRKIEQACVGRDSRSYTSVYRERLLNAHRNAYERFTRRQDTLFSYNVYLLPCGSALPVSEPQGATPKLETFLSSLVIGNDFDELNIAPLTDTYAQAEGAGNGGNFGLSPHTITSGLL